jgi:hypothetical protein
MWAPYWAHIWAEFEGANPRDTFFGAFPTLTVWIREVVQKVVGRGEGLGDANMRKLSMPPKLVSKLYSKMQAYEDHYVCDDGSSAGLVGYDCGVASILKTQGSTIGSVMGQIQYVGVLRHI